ncbi:MAG: Ig-like domain-containing protein [Gaiellaceae bacterium]
MAERVRRLTFLGAIAVALLSPVAAIAYVTSHGSGSAIASSGLLNPPTAVVATATAGSGTVPVGWTASSTGGAAAEPQGYFVLRYSGSTPSPACGSSPSSLITGTACNDSGVPDGTYTYSVVARYHSWAAESAHSTPSTTVVNDATAPTATISFPGSGPYRAATWGAGCNVSPFNTANSICGTADDPGPTPMHVGSVQVSIQSTSGATMGKYWDGLSFASVFENRLTANGTSRWILGFPASSLSDGSYTVRAYATDNAANTQTTATSQAFTSDTTAPSVTLTSPASNSFIGTTTPGFSGSCTTGDRSVTVTVRQGATTMQVATASCDAGSYSVGASPPLAAGGYTAEAAQTDAVGNTGSSGATTFTVDTAAPTTTITFSPATPNGANGWYTTSPMFTLSGQDATSGVVTTKYQIDGGAIQAYAGGAVSIHDGRHTVSYWSIDGAGNSEATKTTAMIKVDTIAPADALSLASASGAFLNGSTLFYKANAAGSFTFVDTVTDLTSGPSSASFPALTGSEGWTHAAETVTTPAGGPYVSSPYTWTATHTKPMTRTVTSSDVAANSSLGTTVTFTSDTTAPTGGSISYSSALYTALSVPIALSNGTDTGGSGVDGASGIVQRDQTALTDGVCGTFPGTFSTTVALVGGADTSGGSGNCYRYRYVISDNVGNRATWASASVAKVDVPASAPAPAPASVAALDGRSQNVPGKIDAGNKNDTLTFTYSEAIATASITTGNISVTFTDGGGTSNDAITVPGIGVVDLGASGWLTATSTKTEALARVAADVYTLTITTDPTGNAGGNAASSFVWSTAGGTATDPAGNLASGSTVPSNQRF